MSTWSAGNLLDRMREVLQEARGSLRTISASTLLGDLPPGLETNEEARRALATLSTGAGIPTESRIVSVKRSPASPPVIGNLALYDIEAEVRQVFPFTSLLKLSDSFRDAVQGIAGSMADTIAQAFTYPGNLLTKQNGASTGLVSGMFAYVGSDYRWTGLVNEKASTLEAVHRFKGVVRSAPAT